MGVQTEDALRCLGTKRLLKNAFPKGNFAKYPDPLKLKPEEMPVLRCLLQRQTLYMASFCSSSSLFNNKLYLQFGRNMAVLPLCPGVCSTRS